MKKNYGWEYEVLRALLLEELSREEAEDMLRGGRSAFLAVPTGRRRATMQAIWNELGISVLRKYRGKWRPWAVQYYLRSLGLPKIADRVA